MASSIQEERAALALQPTLGMEWDPPQPKLRVRYAIASATFGCFIPAQLSASRDGLLERCFADGGPLSGEEMLRIGGREMSFYVTAAARDFVSAAGPTREVLSLLLSSGAVPVQRVAPLALWDPSRAFD